MVNFFSNFLVFLFSLIFSIKVNLFLKNGNDLKGIIF